MKITPNHDNIEDWTVQQEFFNKSTPKAFIPYFMTPMGPNVLTLASRIHVHRGFYFRFILFFLFCCRLFGGIQTRTNNGAVHKWWVLIFHWQSNIPKRRETKKHLHQKQRQTHVQSSRINTYIEENSSVLQTPINLIDHFAEKKRQRMFSFTRSIISHRAPNVLDYIIMWVICIVDKD